jgi:Ca-activated chloride channel homolog
MRSRFAVLAMFAVCLVPFLSAQGPPGQALTVEILSPTDDSYVSGPTMVRARVEPSDGATVVTFFVDGRQVCHVTKAPFECEFNAGLALSAHQIRVVATGAGTRAVDTVATKGVGYTESVDVELVPVTAIVMDGQNHYVKGLPKGAFRVFEDGRLQTISHFASEDVPLDIVLAIDMSGSMKDFAPKVKEVVKEFLKGLTARDQVTLLAFNDNIFPLVQNSTDSARRLEAVDRLAPWGGTALYDVIIAGIDSLEPETGRKAMLVFTDAEDQDSHATLADAERRLQSSDVTLYMIGQGRGVKIDPLKKVMHQLADASGGRAFVTEKLEDLQRAFRELLEELSNQYVLGYTPTNSRHDGTLRRLKVEVDGRLKVRAREAYRASGK